MAEEISEFQKAVKKFILEAAAHSPVIGVAVAWWANILNDPLIASGLMVIYELGVMFWKMLGKHVWEVVWEQKLKGHTVNVLAEWLTTILLNLFSNFRRQYMQQVTYDHRVFPVRGLLTPGQGDLDVEQVFVELQIAHSHHLQVSANPIKVTDLPGSQPVWTFLRRLKKKDATALAILGPPGCGKTTLLKHIALTFAARRHRRYRVKTAIPILLLLREHVAAITEESLPLADIAQQHFSDPKRYPDFKPPPYWFACQLRAGRCIVLLDGLDEVQAEHLQAVSTWVEQQIRIYPHSRFLLTARPQGYRNNPLARAQTLEVLLFNEAQVERFIHNWYVANKRIASGEDDKGVRQGAERDAQDLRDRLKERPRLKELTVNPLLLTMIANVHNYRAVLPEKRVDLYEEICDVFLGHWQEAKGIAGRLNARQKRVVLQPLAEAMMMQHTRELSTLETLTVMTPFLLQVGIAEQDIPLFMKDVAQATSGLLGEQETNRWGFAHFTFQEYLCAAHWDKTGKAADWETARWQELIGESWWHETLRLYAAQADADVLVQACLSLGANAALQLARDIEQEALTITPAIRDNVTRALKGLVVVRLRSEPLTVSDDEFRKVFGLDKNQRPLEYIQNEYEDQGEVVVDHATGLMWQKSGSDTGMFYADAQEYVKELNRQKFAGHADWRLPTIPELMSLLEPEQQENGLYIKPIFDSDQTWCWSADRRTKGESSSGSAWLVYFGLGGVSWDVLDVDYYVRVVRS